MLLFEQHLWRAVVRDGWSQVRQGQVLGRGFPRDNLQKSLKGQFNKSVWEHLAGTTSEPFVAVAEGQVAIKVIDERGNELMRVFSVAEAEQ